MLPNSQISSNLEVYIVLYYPYPCRTTTGTISANRCAACMPPDLSLHDIPTCAWPPRHVEMFVSLDPDGGDLRRLLSATNTISTLSFLVTMFLHRENFLGDSSALPWGLVNTGTLWDSHLVVVHGSLLLHWPNFFDGGLTSVAIGSNVWISGLGSML